MSGSGVVLPSSLAAWKAASEMLEQQQEILALRQQNAELRLDNYNIPLLIAIIERYQAAIRSTGAVPSEDELAFMAKIRRGARV